MHPSTSQSENGTSFDPLDKFFPKQLEAVQATERFKFVLYGGSVGAGKSFWLRWTCIYWLIRMASEYNLKGIRAGLFCEDYPALEDRHLSKIKFEFPIWLGEYNAQRREFVLDKRFGSGVLAFRNLDDPSKYLSVEFAIEAVDEVNRNPHPTFIELRKRLRWPGIKKVKFFCACNPIGEAWVKNIFVKRLFPPEEKEQFEFVYISALPKDNPYLDESYFKGLESLPEAQRKAVLEANWDAFDDSIDDKGYLRLITDRELQGCLSSDTEHSGYRILGVDPAAGGDKSTVVLKSGNLQQILFDQKLEDTMDLVGVIADLYRQYSCSMIAIDSTGVGKGVFHRLREMDFPVKEVVFGEKAENSDMFANLKAELHWKQREWLLSGGRLSNNPGWNEFEYVKYKNRDGKIIIQPKEELFKQGLSSPNCVDAAVITQSITVNQIKSSRILKSTQGQGFHDWTVDVWNNK